MKAELVEFSVVVVAHDHNPTILNPDFLGRNEIVRDDWNWRVVGQPITTPAISTVQYDSKVAVTVEPMKLQVSDSSGGNIDQNHSTQIVSNYVSSLPHVPYSALGINFTATTIVDDAVEFLITRYLKTGAWNSKQNKMRAVGYKFTYELANGFITFSIDKGGRAGIAKPVVVTRANFHRNLDLAKMPTSEQVVNLLKGIHDDWKRFEDLQSTIVES